MYNKHDGPCGCGHPKSPRRIGMIDYSAQSINELLNLIPRKANREEVSIPDGEDLAIEEGFLKLKDKKYNRYNYSGLGRCYLRKNMVDDVNVLTQDMFTNEDGSSKENTRYIIQYDYDLNGATINLPSGCALDFQGGSFSNGKVQGSNSYVFGSLKNVFRSVRLTGSWLNDRCNLNWWNVKTGAGVDNSASVQDAFNSAIRIIEVCGAYYLSSPVQIPVNKTIEGQSKDNNKLHGFYANDNFSSKSVTLDGSTYTAYGVLYTGSNYRTELNNIFVDARHKADYCIEHISNSVTWNIIKVGIFNARKVGLLQYGCERAVFKNLYLYGNNVGMAIRYNTYNNANPFDFSGAVKTIPNIITIDDVYAIANNIGMIVQYGTNVHLGNVNTSHNSIVGLYLRGVTGNSYISNYYSEGDGCCSFYIDEDGYINNSDGTKTGPIEVNTNPSFSNGKAIQTLIDKNLDGFSNGKSEPEYGQIVYQRVPLVIDGCNISIIGVFFSVKPRGNSNTNEKNVLPPTSRNAGGVDALILFRGQCNVFARSVSQYMTASNTGAGTLATFIEHCTTNPSKIDIGFYNGTRPIRLKTKYSERPLTSFKSTSTDNRYIGKTAVSFANKIDYNRNLEKSRYGATSNYNLKSGKLVETYKGVPLYLQNTNFKQAQYRMMYLTKEKALEMFGDLKEVKIKFYIKVLEDIPSSYIYSSVQIMNGGSNVLNSIIASSNAQTIEAGYYEFESIVPVYTSAAYDQILISVRENSNSWDKVAYSDIFFYDPADGEMAKYEYTDKHLRKGSTSGRPQGVHYGFTYYDTLLGKGITSKGDDTWVDESGQTV